MSQQKNLNTLKNLIQILIVIILDDLNEREMNDSRVQAMF